MIFQEPKVEFVELELVETTSVSGGQGEIGQCTQVRSDEDCAGGEAWNYD